MLSNIFTLVLATIAIFSAMVSAAPADLDKRYTLRCNPGRGPFSANDLQNAIGAVRDNEFNVCPDNKCCVTPGLSNHLTNKGKVYVSLRAETDPKAPLCSSRSEMVSGMQRILDSCKADGGSGPADNNEHLVVHITDAWV